jgi:hypothetical protein
VIGDEVLLGFAANRARIEELLGGDFQLDFGQIITVSEISKGFEQGW